MVNINTASLDELDTLPGVGPVTAQKIVDARPFSSTSEIQNVQGIGGPGSKTYEDIIGLITVSGATTVTENKVDNEDDTADDNQTTSLSSSGGKEEKHEPVSGLTLIMPNVAYTGQLIDFDVNPVDGTNNRLVRYAWNFGDGQTSSEKATEHQYARAGTYVVVVESYFQKETKSARREIVILPLTLDFNSLPGGGVEVTNKGEYEIDLSGMILHGSTEFVFPKNTILLAGKSFVVDPVSGPGIALKDETGRPLAFKESAVKPATTLASVTTRSVARQRPCRRRRSRRHRHHLKLPIFLPTRTWPPRPRPRHLQKPGPT